MNPITQSSVPLAKARPPLPNPILSQQYPKAIELSEFSTKVLCDRHVVKAQLRFERFIESENQGDGKLISIMLKISDRKNPLIHNENDLKSTLINTLKDYLTRKCDTLIESFGQARTGGYYINLTLEGVKSLRGNFLTGPDVEEWIDDHYCEHALNFMTGDWAAFKESFGALQRIYNNFINMFLRDHQFRAELSQRLNLKDSNGLIQVDAEHRSAGFKLYMEQHPNDLTMVKEIFGQDHQATASSFMAYCNAQAKEFAQVGKINEKKNICWSVIANALLSCYEVAFPEKAT